MLRANSAASGDHVRILVGRRQPPCPRLTALVGILSKPGTSPWGKTTSTLSNLCCASHKGRLKVNYKDEAFMEEFNKEVIEKASTFIPQDLGNTLWALF